MFGFNWKKVSHCLNFVQFKIGELFFPILEPLFRMYENRNPEVKRHFGQAMVSLEKKRFNVALLNLNMALSLKPNHFLARAYRGRIYMREGRYRLAAEDYIFANTISRYRFLHYDLYREYFISLNKGIDLFSSSVIKNFNQVFEAFHDRNENREEPDDADMSTLQEKIRNWEEAGELDIPDLFEDHILTEEEQFKFFKMGPITQGEVDKTDWDALGKELSSNREDS